MQFVVEISAAILQWLWKQELAEPIVKKQRMKIIVERQQMNDELLKKKFWIGTITLDACSVTGQFLLLF